MRLAARPRLDWVEVRLTDDDRPVWGITCASSQLRARTAQSAEPPLGNGMSVRFRAKATSVSEIDAYAAAMSASESHSHASDMRHRMAL